ncbi:c-type cytochrome [Ideonella sp. DXS22W]|uniref:C-type cytochrome n=1 Tax=Pseudaquabacterium inlustre TaxID=2984192 RepID=A0ABU9CQC3_9BURK
MNHPISRHALAAIGVTLSLFGASAQANTGTEVYKKACAMCHDVGLANAPKFGDKAAWAPRLASGRDALVTSAIKGKGVMPPKGGSTALSDDEVKAAVDAMLASVKP